MRTLTTQRGFNLIELIVVIVVLGGLGSIPGAILGGIIIGIIETVGAQYMAATWTELLIYAVFLVVLFVKPSGLFGLRQDF